MIPTKPCIDPLGDEIQIAAAKSRSRQIGSIGQDRVMRAEAEKEVIARSHRLIGAEIPLIHILCARRKKSEVIGQVTILGGGV